MLRLSFFLSVLVLSNLAMAEVRAPSISALLPTQVGSAQAPAGVWFFAGANTAIINSDIYDNLNNGDLVGMRLVASLYQPTMIYNLGFDIDAMKLEKFSRANNLALDIAARYRLTDRWSAGGEAVTYLHSGSTISGENEDLSPFVGAGIARDIPFTSTLMRIGGRAMIDLSIGGQTATMAQLYLELGSNFAEPTRVSEIRTVEPEIEFPVEKAPVPTALPAKQSKIEVMTFNFDVSSARLARENRARLEKLAKVLKANQSLYGSMEIVGHADRTGGDRINNPLSKSRAITVAEVIRSVGLNKHGQVIGKGSHQPISDTDLAANRRVELVLTGVKDSRAIENLIKAVR